MKKTFSSKKSAFSLIELSIVLIIIGLLIAGVTGGASLIKSSELRAAISEARGYAVAVNGFFAQYNALPGDYKTPIAGSSYAGSTNGENSKIQYYASDTSAYTSESVVAWNQLIATGTIDSTLALTYTAVSTAQTVGTMMPSSKIKFAGWHFDYRNNVGAANNYESPTGTAEGAAAAAANQNVVVLTPPTTAWSSTTASLVNGTTNLAYTTAATGALTGPDALSIDTKVDDGLANAGRVRGLNPGLASTNGCYVISASANATYVVSSGTNKTCNLTFQVDVNS